VDGIDFDLKVKRLEMDILSGGVVYYLEPLSQRYTDFIQRELPVGLRSFIPCAVLSFPGQGYLLVGEVDKAFYHKDSKGGSGALDLAAIVGRVAGSQTEVCEVNGRVTYKGRVAVGLSLGFGDDGYSKFVINEGKDNIIVQHAGATVTQVNSEGTSKVLNFSGNKDVVRQEVVGSGVITYGDYTIILDKNTDVLRFEIDDLGTHTELLCDGKNYSSLIDLPGVQEVHFETNQIGNIVLKEKIKLIISKTAKNGRYERQVKLGIGDKTAFELDGFSYQNGNPVYISLDSEGKVIPQHFTGTVSVGGGEIVAAGRFSIEDDGSLKLFNGTTINYFNETADQVYVSGGAFKIDESGLIAPASLMSRGYVTIAGQKFELVPEALDTGSGAKTYKFDFKKIDGQRKVALNQYQNLGGELVSVLYDKDVAVRWSADKQRVVTANRIENFSVKSLTLENGKLTYKIRDLNLQEGFEIQPLV
ncbi:MAG: hypothetical protein JSV34_07020, partial [Candidatus Omnitrophota bacterium]